jgi:hypothetical protein
MVKQVWRETKGGLLAILAAILETSDLRGSVGPVWLDLRGWTRNDATGALAALCKESSRSDFPGHGVRCSGTGHRDRPSVSAQPLALLLCRPHQRLGW